MTNTDFDIIISGGGMAGLAMALALADMGKKIAIIERGTLQLQHLPEFDGRVSAIAYGSKIMLEKLGAWQHMAPYAERITDIRVSDNQSPFFLHYNYAEVGTEPFGWIVENRHTRIALYKALCKKQNIHWFENTRVAHWSADDERAEIGLSSGITLSAPLAIAAEGKFSELRSLAGIHAHTNDYKQTAIVCTIAHTKPHQGLAQERFLKRGPFAVLPMCLPTDNHITHLASGENSNLTHPACGGGRGGDFSALTEASVNVDSAPPLPPPQAGGVNNSNIAGYSSLVWVEPKNLAENYLNLPKAEAEREITERVGGYLGDISLVGKMFSYPLGLSVANSMTAKRLALIGDAAHAIHPLAGQGINLGFRDVAVLHEVLQQALAAGQDLGSDDVLKAYSRWRSLDTFSMALVTDGLTRLFTNDSSTLKLARGLGLYAVGKVPPLKQFFMKHAMGKIGDLPQLMKV